jgi:PIN domain nuclease of toxin-antitoxin system
MVISCLGMMIRGPNRRRIRSPRAGRADVPAKKARSLSRRQTVREPAPSYVGLPAVWRASASPARATPLLLDTHLWLWTLDQTQGALTTHAIGLVERAAAEQRLYVSDFSYWEVAMLVSKGRLRLATDVGIWLERAALAPGITSVPVTRDVLIRSTRLPGEPHGDPADRILLAHAQTLGAALMTCDRGIIAYAVHTPGIPVCDARG